MLLGTINLELAADLPLLRFAAGAAATLGGASVTAFAAAVAGAAGADAVFLAATLLAGRLAPLATGFAVVGASALAGVLAVSGRFLAVLVVLFFATTTVFLAQLSHWISQRV